ncbi:hypothetical protein V8F20_005577 [Naviculisporaceae sp. PSN 640]
MTNPSEQTVLITGSTGYVGSHVLKLILERGYKVRLPIRSDSSAAGIRAKFSRHESQLSFSIVSDITKPELFADAFANTTKPLTAVIHTAAPFVLNVQDMRKDLLDPIIGGSVAILEAIKRYGPDVRRVVNTSSFAAILDLSKGARPGYTYSEADWNPMTYEEASVADAASAYCAAKGLGENAMWDWIEAEKPAFSLVSVNPPWVFGPHVGGVSDTKKLNESSHALYSLLDAKEIPPMDFCGYTDSRTIAQAHIAALEKEEAAGQRFLVGSHFDYQSAVDALRKELPSLAPRLPLGTPGKSPDVYHLDGSKAERVLGIKYIPLDETIRDSFLQFLEADNKATA